ncbi:MAG: hypothetical protein ACYC9Y_02000 [Candidatus Methylomirabilia bacterium]
MKKADGPNALTKRHPAWRIIFIMRVLGRNRICLAPEECSGRETAAVQA